jgi:cell division protein FtsI/penicillin-binding protein 2
MRRPSGKAAVAAAIVAALAGGTLALVTSDGAADAPRTDRRAGAAAARRGPARELVKGFDPREHRLHEGRRVADLPEGRTAVLTLDDGLQSHVTALLERYDVPWASVVAIEPASGRVLAYISHSSANPGSADLALDATPPTASVFKVITGTALVDAAGVSPDTRVCYGGGFSRLTTADLADDPLRDRMCGSLSDAMGGSINTIFAKLALRHLDAATLERYAAAFGFGHALPFDVPTRPSPAEIPAGDPLEFARTAAGFWHVHMSPLHGSLVAATIGNHGRMPRAAIIERITDRGGATLYQHEASTFRSVVGRGTAETVTRMMQRTVTSGTARRAFHDNQGRPFLPGIAVAGKTGTLSAQTPYRGYTWWVGFAPAEQPTIAVAVLVVNTPRWRIKASLVAREALRYYLVERASVPIAEGERGDE